MKKNNGILSSVSDRLNLSGAALPNMPVAELWGDKRLLIEHHRGVASYSREEICVCVGYGMLTITGEGLDLSYMTGDQLVICGKINEITVIRRGSC